MENEEGRKEKGMLQRFNLYMSKNRIKGKGAGESLRRLS
jgi:hypothetical protein